MWRYPRRRDIKYVRIPIDDARPVPVSQFEAVGGFELVGFVWVGFKLHIWLGDKRRQTEEEQRRQEELRKEEEKRERQERLRRKIKENSRKQFEQAVMSGRFPSE
jgi:hypothetical protein